MQKYIDQEGQIHELDSDEFEHLLPEGCTKIDEQTAKELLAPSPTELWRRLQADARSALAANDLVAIRCIKAADEYPTAWRDYDTALRLIVATEQGDAATGLPQQPEYPPGS